MRYSFGLVLITYRCPSLITVSIRALNFFNCFLDYCSDNIDKCERHRSVIPPPPHARQHKIFGNEIYRNAEKRNNIKTIPRNFEKIRISLTAFDRCRNIHGRGALENQILSYFKMYSKKKKNCVIGNCTAYINLAYFHKF